MYLVTQELYHDPDASCDLMGLIGHKAKKSYDTPDEFQNEGYEPCPKCVIEYDG